MAMASACGLIAAAPVKVASNRWDASSSSLPSSESFQCRTASASSAFCSSSTSSASTSKALTFSERGSLRKHHGMFRSQRRRRIGVRIVAEGGEGEEPREAVSDRWSLDELDQQLKALSSRESSAPRQIPVPRQSLGASDNEENAGNGSRPKLQWPALTPGFFVYAGIGLLLLTIVNNVLFNTFVGPGVDRKEASKTSVPIFPRYRVTTLQEEGEAREAKEAQQEALAAQSREAPKSLE